MDEPGRLRPSTHASAPRKVERSLFCSIEAKPSIAPPTGNCVGPAAFTSRDTITYRFLSGGNPVPNCLVAIEVYAEQKTGGHCHADASRPTGTPGPGEVVSGNTGADGNQFRVVHTWPEVGGRLKVLFYSTQSGCPFFNDRDTAFTYCILHFGLNPLPAGTGYEFIGGPDNVSRHPDHHMVRAEVRDALQSAATAFAAEFPDGPLLGINDISLMWGGVFDIDGASDWRQPHCSHRRGIEIDLRTSNLGDRLAKLERILRERRFRILKEKQPPHWHLTLPLPEGGP
jgi:hypothetical protein